MVYAIGPISGCHINPAITISMLVAGKINLKDTLGYIISQCIGATLAAFVLYQIATTHPDYSLAVNGIGQNGFDSLSPMNYPMAGGFLAEVVLTFIFLLVIFGATSPKADSKFAGIAIGLALAMIHMVGIPITGTSVNPARSLGPAVVMGGAALSQLWLFWIAPIIGGVLATLFYKVVLSEKS
jgi:aquaporin Z